MADNFLEKHREEYEQRKARYMSHGSHLSKEIKEMIAKIFALSVASGHVA